MFWWTKIYFFECCKKFTSIKNLLNCIFLSSWIFQMLTLYVYFCIIFRCAVPLLEHQKYILLRDFWYSKLSPLFNSCSFYQHYLKLDIYGRLRWLFSCIVLLEERRSDSHRPLNYRNVCCLHAWGDTSISTFRGKDCQFNSIFSNTS